MSGYIQPTESEFDLFDFYRLIGQSDKHPVWMFARWDMESLKEHDRSIKDPVVIEGMQELIYILAEDFDEPKLSREVGTLIIFLISLDLLEFGRFFWTFQCWWSYYLMETQDLGSIAIHGPEAARELVRALSVLDFETLKESR